MSKHRLWVEIILLVTGIACALALLMAILGAVAGAAAAVPDDTPVAAQQAFEGMVTCSRCGARHSAEFGRTATTCARICVHSGASFELVEGESTFLLEGDLEGLKRFAGERARIIGTRSGHTIKVSSVTPES